MKYALFTIGVLLAFASSSWAQGIGICYQSPFAFMPDFTNCNNYYSCVDNIGYLQTCPSGNPNFDFVNQGCGVTTTNCAASCSTNLPTALTNVAIGSGICDKYVMCVGTTPIVQSCVAGTQFNTANGKCDLPENAKCEPLSGQCPTGKTLSFIPNGCSADYTVCYNGEAYAASCAAGLTFNSALNACSEATCTTPSPTNQARSALNIPKPLSLLYRPGFACPATGRKSLPYGNDCSEYVFCVNGLSAIMTCAKGLHFDETTESCRLPEEANCRSARS